MTRRSKITAIAVVLAVGASAWAQAQTVSPGPPEPHIRNRARSCFPRRGRRSIQKRRASQLLRLLF